MKALRFDFVTKLSLAVTSFLFIWWVFIQLLGVKESPINYWFSFSYGLLPLFVGIYNLVRLRGSLSTGANRHFVFAVMFFSIGLITWAVGESIWGYYNLIRNIPIPYPSFADAGFILTLPSWSLGVIYLAKGFGLRSTFKNKSILFAIAIIPVFIIIISYYLLIVFARGSSFDFSSSPLKLFFDVSYPLWDVIILILIFIVDVSVMSYLKGGMKFSAIMLTVGLILAFFADMAFAHQTTYNTFYNGNIVDLLYMLSLFSIGLGTSILDINTLTLDALSAPSNLLKQREEELKEVNVKLHEREERLSRVTEEMYKKNLELIEEKRKAEALFYNISESAIVADSADKILLFNRAAQNLISVAESETVGKKFDEIIELHTEKGLVITIDLIRKELEFKKQGLKLSNLTLKTAGDRERFVNLTASRVDVKDVDLYVILISDVTEEIKAEKAREEFISIASHELRTPMTIIKNYLWMLQNKKGGDLSMKQTEYVDKALVSTDRMIKLISDMLDISRMEQGRVELHPKNVDLAALINEIAGDFKLKADQKGIELRVSLSTTLPQVRADEDKLREVIVNLLANAVKFTDTGFVQVVAEPDEKGLIKVSFVDTGKGISKEDLPKLFHKFGRLDNSFVTAAESGGTGLGLYIVKSIIEVMGGKVGVHSDGVGKGTTFWFILRSAS